MEEEGEQTKKGEIQESVRCLPSQEKNVFQGRNNPPCGQMLLTKPVR